MTILGIETSCDETALSVVDATGDRQNLKFDVRSSLVLSQVKLHEKYGGVFPNLAKREHEKNIIPLLKTALTEARLLKKTTTNHIPPKETLEKISKLLEREKGLHEQLIELVEKIEKPAIDRIAVTYGPGLEPTLWVGLNTAKALGELWNIPVIPVNHMEGHICSVLLGLKEPIEFPAIALLISGGHTELVQIEDWMKYKIVGETRDDAVGEAFDKVARMLGLPYPGGPQISELAEKERLISRSSKNSFGNPEDVEPFHFPRPMQNSPDLDFSFAGLKTSVLYTIKKLPAPTALTDATKSQIARAFEDAVVEVLVKKTEKAIEKYETKSLIVAGGVIANKTLREAFEKLVSKHPNIKLFTPAKDLSGDNAVMIALCGYIHANNHQNIETLRASGNLRL